MQDPAEMTEPTYSETLSCAGRGCLVNRALCNANGLCNVHHLEMELATESYTFPGATLAHLDPHQPTMAPEVRAAIVAPNSFDYRDVSPPLPLREVRRILSWHHAVA